MNALLRAQERSNNTPNPFDKSTVKQRPQRKPSRKFGDPVQRTQSTLPVPEPLGSSEAIEAISTENPFKAINPDDRSLKKQSGKVRVRLKTMPDADFMAIVAPKKVPYEKAITLIDGWDGTQPPTDKQLYGVISGAMRARVSEQHINDLFNRVNKKWKSCTKAILKEMREAVQMCVDLDGLHKDNHPGKRAEPTCNISVVGHKDRVAYGLKCIEASKNDEKPIFRYGSELAHIVEIPEEGTAHAQLLNKNSFRSRMNKICDFEQEKPDNSVIGVAVPTEVSNELFDEDLLPLHYLRLVSTYPVFDKQVNLIATNGYHAAAYLYLKLPEGLEIGEVQEPTSKNDLLKALRLLVEEYLADFPFDGYSRHEVLVACGLHEPYTGEVAKPVPPSLLNFLAYLLQPLVRPVIGDSPMPALLVTKPAAGSGATKLIDTAQMIICGDTSTRPAMPSNEEERRKNIFSALLAGVPFISFDNVTGSIDSPVLAALLTSVRFTDRVLGRSEERNIPNTASVAITGNNPSFTRELLRRISLCRLDAGVAEPDKRTEFRHKDLEVWVSTNRGELLWARCTLVANWKTVGCPKPEGSPLASFGSWFNVCGGILEAAGLSGFQTNRHELDQAAGGDEEDPIRELIIQWYESAANPNTKFGFTHQYVGGDYGLAALADSAELMLDAVRRKKVDQEIKYDPTSLGRLLAEHKDKVFDIGNGTEVLLQVGEKTKHGKPWSLKVTKTTND